MIDTLSQREIDSLVDELTDKNKENKRLKKRNKHLTSEIVFLNNLVGELQRSYDLALILVRIYRQDNK